MALLQISEPGQSAVPHQHKLAIGIDLGTTNSLVASVRSGEASTLADEQGQHILPSVVRYQETGVLVGELAKQQASQDPANTVVSVKRFLGRSVQDIQTAYPNLPYQFTDAESPNIQVVSGNVNPVQVSAEILSVLKQRAESTLGGELVGAVVTVPAYFDDSQRQGTKDAAQLAGLNVLRLLNEPTAAAVAYGLDSGQEGIIAVYDLGGGTFDISILRLTKGVFEVLSTGGDSALGGDDFDAVLVDYIRQQTQLEGQLSKGLHRRLLDLAKQAKEALSTGMIRTPSGREFAFPDVVRKSSGRVSHFTQIKNYPVQSFATADIVPIALMHIEGLLSDMKSCIVNTVHDSIVIDVHPDEEQEVIEAINNTNKELPNLIALRWGVDFNVPLLLEAKIGPNWLDTKDVI